MEREDLDRLETGSHTYSSPAHASVLVQELARMREVGSLCDVTLCVGDRRLSAHKLVLSAVSPFFSAMFSSGMRESESGVVELRDIEPSAVKDLVDFTYTSRIELSYTRALQLTPAADMLQFSEVKQACSDYLKSSMTPTNCLKLLQLSETHSCSELHRAARLCRDTHFETVCKQRTFLELSLDQLESCLSSDYLRVSSEVVVLEAALCWLDHDAVCRTVHVPRVLRCVRLTLLDPSVLLDRVWGHGMVSASPECMEMVRRALCVHIASPDTNTRPLLEQV